MRNIANRILSTDRRSCAEFVAMTWGRWLGLLTLCLMLQPGCTKGGGKPARPNMVASADSGEHSESADPTQSHSVQTVVPIRKDLVVKFEQPAPVVAFEEAELHAKVSGYAKSVHVDIGQSVARDEVLLEIDVPELEQDLVYKTALVYQAEADRDQSAAAVEVAEAALITWQAQLELAQAEVKKANSEKLFRQQQANRYAELAAREATTSELADEKRDQLGAANAAYDSAVARKKAAVAEKTTLEAKLAAAKADFQSKERRIDVSRADRDRTQVNLDCAKLIAPFAGVITRRTVDPGAFVSVGAGGRGEALFTLSRIDKVTVVLRVPEREVGAVKIGATAKVHLDALGDLEVAGKVARFSKALEEKTRTMRVEIDIDNPSGTVYPGMYGRPVTLILNEIKNALTVPASAVYAVGGKSYVIQIKGNQAHRLTVKTGYDDGKVVQIVEGLNGDEEVIVSNKGQIAEGQSAIPHRIASVPGSQ